MAYEALSDLLTDENPYGNGLTPAAIEAAVVAIRGDLAKLRAGQPLGPEPRVDGPAARNSPANPAPRPKHLEYDHLMQGLFWYFQGRPVRISKAFRLKYTAADGTDYEILVGFEGSGGGM
jgi:hypothetical protein